MGEGHRLPGPVPLQPFRQDNLALLPQDGDLAEDEQDQVPERLHTQVREQGTGTDYLYPM